jgi:tRNA(Ile)-lysidine synthase
MTARAVLIDKVNNYTKQHHLLDVGDAVIVGLSGGPDSVFLLHALHSLKPIYNLKLIAAHLDHGWREHSQDDVAFCKVLCTSLEIRLVAAHASEISLQRPHNGSREELGRLLRRQFFNNVAAEYSAQKIALAHHQDDQIETFFIRFLRGAGLSGLASMRPKYGNYIRPLLELSKTEIIHYLDEQHISYLVDYTNVSPLYLRNRIRQSVIPALKAADPRFDITCIRTIENLQEAEEFLEKLTRETFDCISSIEDKTYSIDLKKFRAIDPFMQKRLILHWLMLENVPFTPTSAFFDEIMRFLYRTEGGSHRLSTMWEIRKRHQIAFILKAKQST